jgi:hypothetical protein
MIGTARVVIGATARRFASLVTSDQVTYTPRDLNALIDTITTREVAGRLRSRAAWHRAVVDTQDLPVGTLRAWHLAEADSLDAMAADELHSLARGEVR